MKVETNVITSIVVSLIGGTVIQVIMSISSKLKSVIFIITGRSLILAKYHSVISQEDVQITHNSYLYSCLPSYNDITSVMKKCP
jgi:mannose/fructose-specific phosphotransferase system component IIA